jgi:hypothetical protein
MHNQPALGNFRLGIGHLPLDYAQWAGDGRSTQTLQMLIADALGIRTFDVETITGWRDSRFQDKNRFTRAFLSVGSREEGTDLIARIGQIGDLGLVAEWKHDSEPELLRTSNIVVLGDRFPGLRGFYHAKFHLWRIEDINTGAEIPRSRWPPNLVAAAPPGAAPGQPPPPAAAADVSEEEPRSPPPQCTPGLHPKARGVARGPGWYPMGKKTSGDTSSDTPGTPK